MALRPKITGWRGALIIWAGLGVAACLAAAAGPAADGVRAAVTAAGENAQELLARAREAASRDGHREAIDLYLRAIDADSLLRPAVSIELGHQYTWAEKPDSAIVWYTVYLRGRPEDVEARMGLARALAWSDRLGEAERRYEALLPDAGDRAVEVKLALAKTNAWQEDYGEAERIYREILESDPGNLDAKLGLAQTANWSGKHREAAAVFSDITADHPENADAVRGFAEAKLWMGRPDEALEALDRASARGLRSPEMRSLAADINAERAPRGDAGFVYRENSDDGVNRTWRASLTYPLSLRSELGAAYATGALHKVEYPDIDRDEITLTGAHRFSDVVALAAAPGYQLNRFDPFSVEPGADPVDSFDLFVWDAYVTVTPRDWLRMDAGTSRRPMDIPVPVFRRIHVTTENVGLDWRPAHRWATFWQVMYSAYSDGNSRLAAVERAEWLSPWRFRGRGANRLVLLQGLEYSTFDSQPDHGYFSPAGYIYAYGGMRWTARVRKRVELSLDGRLGAEKEKGLDWASVGAFDGAIRFSFAKGTALAAGYFHSGSRLDSPDGFRSNGFYVTLELKGAP